MKIESTADLNLLLQTAQQGSLSAAARAVGCTPAAASAALKRMERQLGVRLFERSTRALRPTEEGERLLDYARRALELLQEGEAQATAGSDALIGSVRLSAPSDLSRSVLLPWLDAFLQAHPGVQLTLHASDRVQDIVRDAVDLALRYGVLADSQLVARPLAITERVLCAAPAYIERHGTPRSPHDLLNHNCLIFHIGYQRYTTWQFVRDGQATAVRVSGDRSADDAAIAHQWAVAGAGVLYKARLDVEGDLRAGRLLRLLPEWEGERYELHAVMPSGRFVPQRVRALVDFLAMQFARN
ncbi:LysR family transcriptional regulator [uncultured Xylophilus sp.]|uniref:LysR family transcriptional regulator n=1 Tax=uncultured Xylophilus sp. TaxID=296832 RepID=UPI0025DE0A63|nr:LysR family transcriptional regulator [uncultured Xylophilus sp.]